MKAFMNHIGIQMRLDLRNKGTLLTFYIIPLLFYMVMGSVFSSVMPQARETLAAAMTIFSITMGAVLGLPPIIIEMRKTGTLRAYSVSGVPDWSVLAASAVSSFINLAIVSLIIFVTAPVIFRAGTPVNVPAYITILFITIIVSISLGLFIGVFARNNSEATILSQAVFMPSLLLSGIMFPADMLPKPLIWLGYMFPASHAMQAFEKWSFKEGAFPDFALIVTLGIGLVCTIVTLMRFRKISTQVLD